MTEKGPDPETCLYNKKDKKLVSTVEVSSSKLMITLLSNQ